MSILFGHPSGTPFSHNAALAHFEAGWLESFCVPWMPSDTTLRILARVKPIAPDARRLARRHFMPLSDAPKIQGKAGELIRLARRRLGIGSCIAQQANEWLMRTMARAVRRTDVRAVHAYEDCSLWQFQEARRRNKACIYDMPIGYYAFWQQIRDELERKYSDWLPADRSSTFTAGVQKRAEMDLADIVLAPSAFVANSIHKYYPDKIVALAPYGVDLTTYRRSEGRTPSEKLRFLFVGHCSVRKGTPLLIEAWQKAALKDAHLHLVGPWNLAEEKKQLLPETCTWTPPVSASRLRIVYNQSDIFVFPSNFEGFALVVLEAMAAGLPVLTTKGRGADEGVGQAGYVVPPDDLTALVEALRWFASNQHLLPELSCRAREQAAGYTWESYRQALRLAVEPYA